MKKNLLSALVLFLVCYSSNAQLKMPAPSPTQTIRQDFGLSFIELSYSRPGVKNRKIFGDQLPFDSIWRTGANQATTLSFGDPVSIGGVDIPAGKYGLLSIPGKTRWTLIITKQLDVTAAAAYKKESDVVRIPVKPVATKEKIETLTMQFANIKPSTCDLQIMWENTELVLPIKTDIDTRVMAQIKDIMTKDNLPYTAAATYYLENGKDLAQAKDWAEKAVRNNPESYPALYLLARVQAKSGDKKSAIATAKQSIDYARKAQNADYVKMNEKLIKEL